MSLYHAFVNINGFNYARTISSLYCASVTVEPDTNSELIYIDQNYKIEIEISQ